MISPHIPTTCQPGLLAEVLTWVPLPPACLFETANCALLVPLCLLSSETLRSYVINGPSYPPMFVFSFVMISPKIKISISFEDSNVPL